ncbi:MAG: VWA domain-containing protein [Planctomycetaceae bacterium]
MSYTPAQPVPARAAFGAWSFYSAFVVSTVVHVGLLLVCWWWLLAAERRAVDIDLRGVWADSESVRFDLDPLPKQPAETSLQRDPGSSPGTLFVRERTLKLPPVSEPNESVVVTRSSDRAFEEALAENVGALKGTGTGNSPGSGNGGGANAGKGFFGIKPDIGSCVYVVDCSGSMNQKHASQWKTRFRRLKAELLRAIGNMRPEQRFYIIFFNDSPIRMPAQTLQPADAKTKRRYLEWMVKQRAVGETDPRGAMHYALKLQPDTIYFLTDGAFAFKMKRDLMSIRQSSTVIHTFAFGNRSGEPVMKQLAEQNGGKYHYVP